MRKTKWKPKSELMLLTETFHAREEGGMSKKKSPEVVTGIVRSLGASQIESMLKVNCCELLRI